MKNEELNCESSFSYIDASGEGWHVQWTSGTLFLSRFPTISIRSLNINRTTLCVQTALQVSVRLALIDSI